MEFYAVNLCSRTTTYGRREFSTLMTCEGMGRQNLSRVGSDDPCG